MQTIATSRPARDITTKSQVTDRTGSGREKEASKRITAEHHRREEAIHTISNNTTPLCKSTPAKTPRYTWRLQCGAKPVAVITKPADWRKPPNPRKRQWKKMKPTAATGVDDRRRRLSPGVQAAPGRTPKDRSGGCPGRRPRLDGRPATGEAIAGAQAVPGTGARRRR